MLFRKALLSIALVFVITSSGCKKATGSSDESNGELQEGLTEVKGNGKQVEQQQGGLQPVAQHV